MHNSLAITFKVWGELYHLPKPEFDRTQVDIFVGVKSSSKTFTINYCPFPIPHSVFEEKAHQATA